MSFPENYIIQHAIGKTTPIADPQKGTYNELLDTALATPVNIPESSQLPGQTSIDFNAPLSTLDILMRRRMGIPSKPKNVPFADPNRIPPITPVTPPELQIAENLPGQGFLDFYDDSDPQMRIFPAFENYPQLTQNVPIETASALKQLFEQLKMNFQ